MKKLILSLTIISILLPSSSTCCISRDQQLIALTADIVILASGTYAYHNYQNQSASSQKEEGDTNQQNQSDQDDQSDDEVKQKLEENNTAQNKRRPVFEKHNSNFPEDFWNRMGEEETPKHLQALIDAHAFEY